MSAGLPGDPDDLDYKAASRDRTRLTPGTGGGIGTFGLGGGGIGLGSTLGGGSDPYSKMRALIRRRYVGPSGPPTGTGMTIPGPQETNVMIGGRPGPSPRPAGPPPVWGEGPEDPSKPWAAGPQGYIDNIMYLLGKMAKGNMFGPGADGAMMDSVRGKAMQDADARRSHADLLARSLGSDPASRASHMLQTDLQAQGDVSKSLSDASLMQMMNKQKFGEQLLMAMFEYMTGRRNAETAPKPGTDWGGIGGALGGGAELLSTFAKLGW